MVGGGGGFPLLQEVMQVEMFLLHLHTFLHFQLPKTPNLWPRNSNTSPCLKKPNQEKQYNNNKNPRI